MDLKRDLVIDAISNYGLGKGKRCRKQVIADTIKFCIVFLKQLFLVF